MTDAAHSGVEVNDPNIHRDLGRHDAKIESLQGELEQLRDALHTVSTQLTTINNSIIDFKGRYKGGLWVVGSIAALGGGVGGVLTWAAGVMSNHIR